MPNGVPPVPGLTGEDGLGLIILQPGDSGNAVRIIQGRLADLGFHTGLVDGNYGNITRLSVAAFQRARGLQPSGLIDHVTLQALGYEVDASGPAAPSPRGMAVETALKLFPDAPPANVRNYWPVVLRGLGEQGLGDPSMALMALATIRAESAGFAPISEYQSAYNTAPGQRPYGLYDFREDLGNNAVGDGDRFKGRGFVQLTGRDNYRRYSQRLGLADLLVQRPELANDPIIAARVLAAFLKEKEAPIRQALAQGDLPAARKLVNGGTHGLEAFQLAYHRGASLIGLA